jgi:hypothetical protein
LVLIADSAIMKRLQHAAIAPKVTKPRPMAHPVAAKTLGKDKTPDPIADAHNEKILPLRLPLLSFPKALPKTVFRCPTPPGLIIIFASLTLISSVAAAIVLGDAVISLAIDN